MIPKKAIVAPVKIGNIQVQGVQLPDGSFAIAVPQVAELLEFPKNQASRKIKQIVKSLNQFDKNQYNTQLNLLHSTKFQFDKITSEINPKSVNILSLEQFNCVVVELAIQQYEPAIKFVRLLQGLSLHQLFSDAFGIKFESEERQAWIQTRQLVKESFRKSLTDALKAYGYTEPWQYGKFIHELQASCNIEDGKRDELTIKELAHLQCAQSMVGSLIEVGFEPYDALKLWISRN